MQHRPLEGIRVLEIGGYIALPYGTAILCALGAEVVKIERPVVGEDFRRQQNEKSPYFRQYNTGKRSLSVDLKTQAGVDLVKALIPHFDVVLENLRPGKVAAMGLSAAECRTLRPDIVYGSVTGFGSSGPLANRPAYDTIGHAFGGLYSIFGDDGHPQLAGGLCADLITGVTTCAGVLAALVGRLKSGRPQHMQTSIMEAVSVLTADSMGVWFEQGIDPSRTSRHPQAQNFCLATASGDYIAVHLSSSPKFWSALCRSMDRLDLLEDPRFSEYRSREANYFELVPVVASEFLKRTFSEWDAVLTAYDVPFAPVLSMSGYREHPQVEHLQMFEPQVDGMPLVRPPWTFDGQRPERTGSAPRVGGDSRAVAAEVLSDGQIDDLVAAGVLFVDETDDHREETST